MRACAARFHPYAFSFPNAQKKTKERGEKKKARLSRFIHQFVHIHLMKASGVRC